MKDVFGKMLDHPIATIIIVGEIGCVMANIINACKGVETKPLISIRIGKKEES